MGAGAAPSRGTAPTAPAQTPLQHPQDPHPVGPPLKDPHPWVRRAVGAHLGAEGPGGTLAAALLGTVGYRYIWHRSLPLGSIGEGERKRKTQLRAI